MPTPRASVKFNPNTGAILSTSIIGTTSDTVAAGDDSRIVGAAQRGENNTFTGSVNTFDNPITVPAPTAGAGGDSHALNRTTGDARFMSMPWLWTTLRLPATTADLSTNNSAAGGTVANSLGSAGTTVAVLTTTTTTDSIASASWNRAWFSMFPGQAAVTGRSIDYSKPMWFSCSLNVNPGGVANPRAGTLHFTIGNINADAAGPLVKPGFGFRIVDETITAVMRVGSTNSDVGSSSAFLRATIDRDAITLAIFSNGAGGVTWYVNGTSIATTSAGPSTETAKITLPSIKAELMEGSVGVGTSYNISNMQIAVKQ